MKRRITAVFLTGLLVALSVAGCSSSGAAESTGAVTAAVPEEDTQEETGETSEEPSAEPLGASAQEAETEASGTGWEKGTDVYFHNSFEAMP